jgi:hypothetical protein
MQFLGLLQYADASLRRHDPHSVTLKTSSLESPLQFCQPTQIDMYGKVSKFVNQGVQKSDLLRPPVLTPLFHQFVTGSDVAGKPVFGHTAAVAQICQLTASQNRSF